jgi:hypothetical protein
MTPPQHRAAGEAKLSRVNGSRPDPPRWRPWTERRCEMAAGGGDGPPLTATRAAGSRRVLIFIHNPFPTDLPAP